MAHVKAKKSWNDCEFGAVRIGDELEIDEAQAEAWVRRGRVEIVSEKPESKPSERQTKPAGPTRTKPDAPSAKKNFKIEDVGKGWFSVSVNGAPVTKEDGTVKKFRKDDADAYVRDNL